jgi:DNA-binding response OmpR family regulator
MSINKPLAFVVEDDPQLGLIFSIALQPLFDVEIIPDGSVAAERLQESIPCIVVLDINLPGLSGVEILKRIRADARLEQVRVIMSTADAIQANDLREDADVVLLKPVSPLQLRELSARLCGI